MIRNERQRQDRSLWETPKMKEISKTLTLGTLSPMTTTTTSSGYSTGSSSISATIIGTIKKSSSSSTGQRRSEQQINKDKAKGLQHLFNKLKNLLLSPKAKSKKKMRPTTSRRISSSNVIRQYHSPSSIPNVLPSALTTSKTISLPFTYYHDSPIQHSRSNFEQISAWLNHTALTKRVNPTQTIDQRQYLSKSSSSSIESEHQEINVVMKQMSTSHIKPPKRSSSLVTKFTRPILEQQHQLQRNSSPTSSFSSSILTKGMSERLISPSEASDDYSMKSSRRRNVDSSRRRTVATIQGNSANKENHYQKHQINKVDDDIYRLNSSLLSNDSEEISQINSLRDVKNNSYQSTENGEDFLNNSYGLTLLMHQKQAPTEKPVQKRHSAVRTVTLPQFPKTVSLSHVPATEPSSKTMPMQFLSPDSFDDWLCDCEVESYFYPKSSSFVSNQNYYDQYYSSSSAYLHGTLC